MRRLILILCACALLSGCGKKPVGDASKKEDGGTAGPAKKLPTEPPDIAADFIAETWKDSTHEIVKQEPTTFRKAPAVAMQVKVKLKGEDMERLLLIQDGRVKAQIAYDPGKSLEDNLKALRAEFE